MVHAEKKNLSLDRMQPGKIKVLPGEDNQGNSYSEYLFKQVFLYPIDYDAIEWENAQ